MSARRSFAADLEDAAAPESIESVVIGAFGWGSGNDDAGAYGFDRADRTPIAQTLKGRVLPWAQARPLLDYSYDDGFGAADCHAVYAWTPANVLYVVEYDGSTSIHSVPRSPRDGAPGMAGG